MKRGASVNTYEYAVSEEILHLNTPCAQPRRHQIMGYDWDSHKETCHRLYIREGWSLERIMAYLKTQFDFTPR